MSRFRFGVLSAIADGFIVVIGVTLAFLIRFLGTIPQYNFSSFVALAPLAISGFIFAGWIYGLYDPEKVDTPWGVTRASFMATTLGTLLMAALAFFGGTSTISFARWTFVIAWVLIGLLFIGWRITFLRFGNIRWPQQNILILGASDMGANLASSLADRAKWGLNVVGFVRHESDGDTAGLERAATFAPILGEYQDITHIITASGANRLIVADPVDLRELIESVALSTGHARIALDIVPDMYEILLGKTDSIVGDIPLMRVMERNLPRYQRFIKRAFDVVVALLLLMVLSPLLLLVALAVKFSDGGSVLYRQKRVGRKQREFTIAKFRTMVPNAESLTGPVLASDEDPRITAVGRVLRRARIDELPQLLNILAGEMSFIGPRPERSFFVEQYLKDIPGYAERFRVLPGVTGLAQVNGGYATTPDLKLKYDLMYVYHQDVVMDLQIIIETLKVVLTGKGAR